MARYTWHKAPNRQAEQRYLELTPATRCVVRELDEIFARYEEVAGNVTRLAGLFGMDRKNTREALQAIAESGLFYVERKEQGKTGTFYTITPASPDQPPSVPQPYSERTPTVTLASPDRAPDKSAKNADLRPASLRDKILPSVGEIDTEAAGATHVHAREGLPAAASDLEDLEIFWASKKGRIPPLGPGEVAAMRETLEVPGATLALVKEIVGRRFEQAKSKPSTFAYFLPAIRDELQRRNLMAAPLATNPSTPTRAAPAKPRITDRAHYLWLVENGLLDNSWANPDEFATPKEAS